MTVCKEGTHILGLILGLVQCLTGMVLELGCLFELCTKPALLRVGCGQPGLGHIPLALLKQCLMLHLWL